MIGGFNTFIKAQKDAKIGECRVFAYKFDTEYDIIFENMDVNAVPELNNENYVPRGGTALYDSLGFTIDNIGKRLANTDECDRPEKVLVVIITDGGDNDHLTNVGKDVHFSSEKVKEMVKHQTDNYKWEFAYIGANQDAWAVGGSMGVANNLNYAATSNGTAMAFATLGSSTVNYRSGKTRGFTFAKAADTEDSE